MAIRIGSKVQYKHGRGLATGQLLGIKEGMASIKTKNYAVVSRPVSAVSPVSGGK